MRALALEHLRPDPVGIFGDVLAERGIGVDRVLLYDDEPLPDWREYDLIVAMGAGMSVWQEDEFPWIAAEKRSVREAVLAGVPYFGVCFGAQLLADVFGARSFRGPEPELGVNQVFLTAAARRDPVFRGFPPDLEVCEWHSNHFSLPPGAERLARSPRYENQAIRYGRVAYGIQCHLEPSLEDIRAWLDEFPDTVVAFEARHGPGSLERLLDDYADFVPFLQQTGRQVFGRWLENAVALGGLGGVARSARGGRGPAEVAGGLIGRAAELARIDAALAAARHGESAVLVLRGEGGMGKTALLEAAGARARGLRILRAGGDETHAEHPFGGLAELCRPLATGVDALSPQRAQAVAGLLGMSTAANARERFAAYAGAFDLLVSAAAATPLLILVDDAHLLDEASVEAVGFIARRLGHDGVALLIATEVENEMAEAEELRLDGLAPPDAHALLEACWGGGLDPAVGELLVGAAEGNPLALLEIPLDLTAPQRAGRAPVPGEEPLPTSAEWAFLRRVSRLSAPARQALLVAALESGGEEEVIARACTALRLEPSALDAGLDTGLIRRDGGRVRFCHPLARTAVEYSALRADRRAAHGALADALEGEARVWHRARAAAQPDEAVAAALEAIATGARDQGAFAAAARGLELSVRLTADDDARAARLLAAARCAHLAGHINAALDHLDAVLTGAGTDAVRRDAEHLRGRIAARSGSAEAARDRLVTAAARWERDDPAATAELLADAVLPALRAGGPTEAVRIARRAMRLAQGAGGRVEISAAIMLGTALTFSGEYAEGAALIDRAAVESEGIGDLRLRAYLGASLALVGRHAPARRVLGELVEEARVEGAVGVLPYALIRLAHVELETGGWPAAASALHQAARLARESGQVADYGLAIGSLAWLDAAQGHDERCRARVEEALELAARLGSGSRLDRAATALGLLELGSGRAESAVRYLEDACRSKDEQGWSDAAAAPHHLPELVEAYALAGRVDEANAALDRFWDDAHRAGRSSSVAAAWRCRMLLAGEEDLDAAFAEALGTGERVIGPFDRARTQLLYGVRLIGANRPEDAHAVLCAALAGFEHLGAEPWAERARASIRARGGEVPPRRVGVIERLTPRELEVALAAAEGASPREVAEQLFLGPRTVQLALASATIKLGLESPAELASALARDHGGW